MRKSNSELGRLTKVDLRSVWENEASQFTPWLAREDNLRLLGETVGIELELEAEEKDVGPFRADILCRDSATGDWILIENQLARTDHTHLGQLITYAAGLRAVTVVWIADRFTEEHRAALDWLNEMTDAEINFFGLEVELWRIGDSAVAPKFNAVSKPNDWSRSVSEAASRGELTEREAIQEAFWTAFREYVAGRESDVRPTKARPSARMSMALGRSGCRLSGIASFYDFEAESFDSHEVRAQVDLWDENAKAYFAGLEAEKDAIESELGYELVWHSTENARKCRVWIRRAVPDLADRSSWLELHAWLLERLEDFRRVFDPRVKNLRAA